MIFVKTNALEQMVTQIHRLSEIAGPRLLLYIFQTRMGFGQCDKTGDFLALPRIFAPIDLRQSDYDDLRAPWLGNSNFIPLEEQGNDRSNPTGR